jgi:hypothetical protein
VDGVPNIRCLVSGVNQPQLSGECMLETNPFVNSTGIDGNLSGDRLVLGQSPTSFMLHIFNWKDGTVTRWSMFPYRRRGPLYELHGLCSIDKRRILRVPNELIVHVNEIGDCTNFIISKRALPFRRRKVSASASFHLLCQD